MNDTQKVTGKVADGNRKNAIAYVERQSLDYAKKWLDYGGPDALEEATNWIAWGTEQMMAMGWQPPTTEEK